MTNHGETTGSSENGDIAGSGGDKAHRAYKEHKTHEVHGGEAYKVYGGVGHEVHTGEGRGKRGSGPTGLHVPAPSRDGHGGEHQVTLRTPAELADALPYLLGYRPEDSIVLVALHDKDGHGRFGGRARLGIPANADDWPSAARQLAQGLIKGSERRGARPESMVAFLCQEPEKGQTGRQVMERLRPLAQNLRVECGAQDVVVVEALCISEGRYWSYCCDNPVCCSPEGASMGLPGTSVLAAAATYAGIQVRGSLRELRARLQPWENAAALEQETALDAASMALVPRILDEAGRTEVADETLALAERILNRLAGAEPVSGMLLADIRDDELIGHDEAARIVLGLQDRTTRDRAAEWMEGDEAGHALRLWRSLARRCVGPYGEHAAAPLTLAGWVAWSTGDELEAREALAMALGANPDYLFARLLHQACNEGLDPETIRRCLRTEREGRGSVTVGSSPDAEAEAEERAEAETDGAVAGRQGEDAADGLKPAAPAAPPAGTPSRRRRRPRSAGGSIPALDATRGRVRAANRDPGRRSTSARRTPTEAARPAGAAEATTRPGRGTTASTARPGTARTDGPRARAPREAALSPRDTGQEGLQPGHGTSGHGTEGQE
ncbi:DUF4192 domain-containing protein [Streptomyces sp. bgisy032]|uniref:DUF4192 domain-containing protein n=1 Tax=Streptomyces sp. bgisy032 TaxID=3413773 RepID=UPI003D70BE1B